MPAAAEVKAYTPEPLKGGGKEDITKKNTVVELFPGSREANNRKNKLSATDRGRLGYWAKIGLLDAHVTNGVLDIGELRKNSYFDDKQSQLDAFGESYALSKKSKVVERTNQKRRLYEETRAKDDYQTPIEDEIRAGMVDRDRSKTKDEKSKFWKIRNLRRRIIAGATALGILVSPSLAEGAQYKAGEGDSAWKISKAYGITTEEFYKLNPEVGKDRRHIVVKGKTYIVPDNVPVPAEKSNDLSQIDQSFGPSAEKRAEFKKQTDIPIEEAQIVQEPLTEVLAKISGRWKLDMADNETPKKGEKNEIGLRVQRNESGGVTYSFKPNFRESSNKTTVYTKMDEQVKKHGAYLLSMADGKAIVVPAGDGRLNLKDGSSDQVRVEYKEGEDTKKTIVTSGELAGLVEQGATVSFVLELNNGSLVSIASDIPKHKKEEKVQYHIDRRLLQDTEFTSVI